MVLTHACYAFFRSRYGSGQSEEEVRERRHSHTITSMTDSESPPQLPSPTHVTQPFLGKTPPTNVGEWSQTLLRCEAHDWDQSSSTMIWRSLSLSLSTVAPIPSSGSGSQITRSSSIPANDMSYELYGTSPLGSSLSLADRPKSMMRSGSFREPSEDGEPWALAYSSIWCNMHKCFILLLNCAQVYSRTQTNLNVLSVAFNGVGEF